MSRQRPGPARADWADPRRLAALTGELRTQAADRDSRRSGRTADSRPRDDTGRVLSPLKVTIRFSSSGTVRYFDSWNQLSAFLTGEDFDAIAGDVRSVMINHRPAPKR